MRGIGLNVLSGDNGPFEAAGWVAIPLFSSRLHPLSAAAVNRNSAHCWRQAVNDENVTLKSASRGHSLLGGLARIGGCPGMHTGGVGERIEGGMLASTRTMHV